MNVTQAAREALHILEAAGLNDESAPVLRAAHSNLRRHVETEDRRAREAEDAKVREFVKAIPGVSYADESEDHWRHLYHAAREFFTRNEKPQHECVDSACQHVDRPRVLNYGDPEPERDTKWRDTDGDVWHWDGYAWTGDGAESTWGDIYHGYFPMTEVTP